MRFLPRGHAVACFRAGSPSRQVYSYRKHLTSVSRRRPRYAIRLVEPWAPNDWTQRTCRPFKNKQAETNHATVTQSPNNRTAATVTQRKDTVIITFHLTLTSNRYSCVHIFATYPKEIDRFSRSACL